MELSAVGKAVFLNGPGFRGLTWLWTGSIMQLAETQGQEGPD